jgi:hypothetical protein
MSESKDIFSADSLIVVDIKLSDERKKTVRGVHVEPFCIHKYITDSKKSKTGLMTLTHIRSGYSLVQGLTIPCLVKIVDRLKKSVDLAIWDFDTREQFSRIKDERPDQIDLVKSICKEVTAEFNEEPQKGADI